MEDADKGLRIEAARAAIGELRSANHVFILTYGAFCLIDALEALLEQTGPADLAVSVWSASPDHLKRLRGILTDGRVRSLRLVIDGSYAVVKAVRFKLLHELFEDEQVRHCGVHAKFAVVRSDSHQVAVRTSMNLNNNKRSENLEVSTSAEFAGFLSDVVDTIFEEMRPGEVTQRRPMFGAMPEAELFREVKGDDIGPLEEPRTTHAAR